MSELLALSFDVEASPSITLREPVGPAGAGDFPFGWGFGWYPGGEYAAVAIKDPTSTRDDNMTLLLRDWERFRSTLFVCHLRGAAKRIAQRDAQPFIRSYAGRHWLFAHSGDLEHGYQDAFPLEADPSFEPLGRTDSEHVFCWLLRELWLGKRRSIQELGGEELHPWLRRMNELGRANVLLADGLDLAVYRTAGASPGIHWLRRTPPAPAPGGTLESDVLELALEDPRDPHRTALVFSTQPLSGEDWRELEPGQLVIARRGAITWSSSPVTSPRVVVPAGHAHGLAAEGAPRSRVLEVFHQTVYRYSEPVERSSHRFRLRPIQDARQELLRFELQTSVDGLQREYEDVFGNSTTSLELAEPFSELIVTARSRVRVHLEEPLYLRSPRERDTIPLVWMPWQRQMMWPYLLPPELPESQLRELSAFAMSFVERADYDLLETLLDMSETIYRDFEYVSGSTTAATTAFEVYTSRRGVCQDFANLLICMARLLSVPARYRMGYIYTGANYANRIQSDASHAWVELYLPWVGWHGLDPTNGCPVNLDHVRVACGRNYIDATPTSGVLYRGGGVETLSIDVRVEDGEAGSSPAGTPAR